MVGDNTDHRLNYVLNEARHICVWILHRLFLCIGKNN